MKTSCMTLAVSLVSATAYAQDFASDAPTTLDTSTPFDAEGAPLDAPAPAASVPTETPPPTAVPTRPTTPAPAPPQDTQVPAGQWVFTQQYGWVYAPYAKAYTYVTPDVTSAQMYVYRATLGWAWVLSPWVLSVGPRPYWSTAGGPRRYAYYSAPWFRPHGWYKPAPNYGYRLHGRTPFHAHPRGPLGPRRWR